MKRVLKTTFIILCIVVLLLFGASVWQWNNIKVILTTINYSPEQIDALVKESESKTEEILKKFTEAEIGKLSEEDVEKLIKGEMTEEEAVEIINKSGQSSEIDAIISKIYVLRSEYLGAIASLESEAFGAAKSIPKKQRTISKKLEILETYTGRAVALEGQCNAKMEGLISELEAEIEKNGGDMSLVSEVRSAYEAEKAAKKSQLFGKYGKYLK